MNSISSVQQQHTNQYSLPLGLSSFHLKLWPHGRQTVQHISWSQGCSTSPLISESIPADFHSGVNHTWQYYWLGHLEVNMLKDLYRKSLVSEMEILRQLQMLESYEDCIFEKIYARSYNKKVIYKKVLLEQIYMDLWGPLSVLLAGGAHYFIMIINSVFYF